MTSPPGHRSPTLERDLFFLVEATRLLADSLDVETTLATVARLFHRLHSTEQASGHGLGLAISRLIARLMDGELTVSGEPGEGATFSLWLPADPEAA